jgi:AAA15 family ATPase/GTPase
MFHVEQGGDIMLNAITRVDIKDFLIFKAEFSAEFSPGVNVIIGGNATGKTTLLKVMYSGLVQKHLPSDYFRQFPPKGNTADLDITLKTAVRAKINISLVDDSENSSKNCIYIPANEILTYAKSLLALNNERYIPFDQTEIDILSKAELGITKKITPNAAKVMDRIRDIIGGEVVYENDEFFINRKDGLTPFGFEAGGFKKLGLLWKLLRNGLLEDGTYLFWDEPENNINPELIPVVVDTLLELAKGGVQVFVTSHDEIMAQYFDIRGQREVDVRFHGIKKTGSGVLWSSAERFSELAFNPIEDGSRMLNIAFVDFLRRERA